MFIIDFLGLENIVVFVSHPSSDLSKTDYERVVNAAQQLREALQAACCGQHDITIIAFESATADALRAALSGNHAGVEVHAVFAIMKASAGHGPRRTRVRGRYVDLPPHASYAYAQNVSESASDTFRDVQVPTVISGSYADVVPALFPENPNITAVEHARIARDRLGMVTGGNNEPFGSRLSHESANLLIDAIRQKVADLMRSCEPEGSAGR